MSKSSEINKIASNTEDDFQEILDDTATTANQATETINDEDAIDRLLMDNAFDNSGGEDEEFAEIDELINGSLADSANDQISGIDDEIDEFADDEQELSPKDKMTNRSSSNDIVEKEPDDKQQKSDDTDGINPADIEAEKKDADTDPFLADLDISDDDENDIDDTSEDKDAIIAVPHETPGQEDEKPEQQTLQDPGFASELSAINTRLSSLQTEQEQFQTQVNANNSQLSAFADELEGHNNEQKKLQRRLTLVEKKLPAALVYAGLVIAVIALITGVGLFIFSYGTDSRTSELSTAVVDLDDKVNAWMSSSQNQDQLNSLATRQEQVDRAVDDHAAVLSEMTKKLEKLDQQMTDEKTSEQIAQLSDSQFQMAAVVESLQRKIDLLEKGKRAASKPLRKKAVVVRENWVVNLIAFRQEWYAKRKALEYEKKGVPAVVKAVVVKGESWYRLLVKGFGKKFDAAAYARKVKKSLNLTSVWVAKE